MLENMSLQEVNGCLVVCIYGDIADAIGRTIVDQVWTNLVGLQNFVKLMTAEHSWRLSTALAKERPYWEAAQQACWLMVKNLDIRSCELSQGSVAFGAFELAKAIAWHSRLTENDAQRFAEKAFRNQEQHRKEFLHCVRLVRDEAGCIGVEVISLGRNHLKRRSAIADLVQLVTLGLKL